MFNYPTYSSSSKTAYSLAFSLLFLLISTQEMLSQTYTRRNSPYSRYGFGDLFSTQFQPGLSTGGGLSATYNSPWDINLSNPASLGHIQFTNFELGAFYKHSNLTEKATGLSAKANDGNLSYFSLAFPITRSWEVESDTLRRGIPIQWGMGFSLSPHSTVGYDVRVTRDLTDVGEVQYKYTGNGTRFRVNWANGWRYKGFSVGANLALLFGTVHNRTTISFLDSAYTYAFNERFSLEENTLGLLWDVGAQYDLTLKQEGKKRNVLEDTRLTFGAYLGGSNNMRIFSNEEQLRYGGAYGTDTLLTTEDAKTNMQLPLTVGAGIAYTQGLKWRFGVNYEAQLWDGFTSTGRALNVANAFQIAAGVEFTPNYKNYGSYIQRIRYRAGFNYGKDPRVVGSGNEVYQLTKYGITFGLGLPVKPPKSTILGHVHAGFEFGYLGDANLIREHYFQFNLAFALNDGAWFKRYKFR